MKLESYASLARPDEAADSDQHSPLVARDCRCKGFVICRTCWSWDAMILSIEQRRAAMLANECLPEPPK